MFNYSQGSLEKVLPGEVFWSDPMDSASSWQCDGSRGSGITAWVCRSLVALRLSTEKKCVVMVSLRPAEHQALRSHGSGACKGANYL
eukprot:1158010-Pelagomonas_calceolata.AAC.1